MSLILNIDTALVAGSVSLSQEGELLQFRTNENQKDHAAWLHGAIHDLMQVAGFGLKDLDTVAVSNGPGSYTGLRIGLSAAKGLCFALQIPLITIGTLEIMAEAARNQVRGDLIEKTGWLCPMIDARRMEVYFAVYDRELSLVHPPQAANVGDDVFAALVEKKKVLFFGNGSEKLKNSLVHDNALFTDNVKNSARDMTSLSFRYYRKNKLADLAYAEPLYIKEFYSPLRK